MLYVDADNAPAIALYRGLDFTRWETDVMFSRTVPSPGAGTEQPAAETNIPGLE